MFWSFALISLTIILSNLASLSRFSDFTFLSHILLALYTLLTLLDLYLWNICLILATSVMRRVLKQASW